MEFNEYRQGIGWCKFEPPSHSALSEGDFVMWVGEDGKPTDADPRHPPGVLTAIQSGRDGRLGVVRAHDAADDDDHGDPRRVRLWYAYLPRIALDEWRKATAGLVRECLAAPPPEISCNVAKRHVVGVRTQMPLRESLAATVRSEQRHDDEAAA